MPPIPVSIPEESTDEMTPLNVHAGTATGAATGAATGTGAAIGVATATISSEPDVDNDEGHEYFATLKGSGSSKRDGTTTSSNSKKRDAKDEAYMADRLSMRLLAIEDDDDYSAAEDEILKETLNLDDDDDVCGGISHLEQSSRRRRPSMAMSVSQQQWTAQDLQTEANLRLCGMIIVAIFGLGLLFAALYVGVQFIGPPNQPVGPYRLIERQEGQEFFDYYMFYEGPDSVGSNGYINYVSRARAEDIGISNVTMEIDELDVYQTRRKQRHIPEIEEEPFLYLNTAPTEQGPRDSIRLEGKRRFNRGLFIIDVRHMPAGCGVWPAFWLTDEANWPINGEIDIVEGVNYQSEAKTALHSTKGCDMFDVPLGTMTGSWDTAVGIPDKKTGIPDMTFRYAQNCFVYDPRQWLNQGCVAVDQDGGSLGIPLNEKGGGVFALEWDPIHRHMRTWVFSPHTKVPDNLVESIRTAHKPRTEDRVMPRPDDWPLPYGYFPIGDGTNCPAGHFRNMRLVLNTALCGSVAGNRFFMDCKNESKVYKTCNEYIDSQPEALKEAYWKIRGVYVYERTWEKTWTN